MTTPSHPPIGKTLMLSPPSDGVIYNPRYFRYEFFFMGRRLGWVDEGAVRQMEHEKIDWAALMWKRIMPRLKR